MTVAPTRFDESLAKFVSVVIRTIGAGWLQEKKAGVLRDASGFLNLIVFSDVDEYKLTTINNDLTTENAYCHPSGAVFTPEQLFDPTLSKRDIYSDIDVTVDGVNINIFYLDRRIIGGDWLSQPRSALSGRQVPMIVFASIKGGVGRSTALSIVARDLAESGSRVLAIDLDLEAPGLGSMLLTPDSRPEFGSLDFYVERGRSGFRDLDYNNLMEPSKVASAAAPVYVVPAFGMRSLKNPGNILGKLSRAYIEDSDENGRTLSFLDRTRCLVEGLLSVRDFDVVLIDGRAGLHETLASPILGLKADVLMFGINEPQTFEGYQPLLYGLRKAVKDDADFLLRLHMVQGKANILDTNDLRSYRDACHKLFATTLYSDPPSSPDEYESDLASWFSVDDADAPHYPWIVPESEIYRRFDPQTRGSQLQRDAFLETYDSLIARVRELVREVEF